MTPAEALSQIETELREATPAPWYFATDKPHDNPLIGNYTQLCSLADEVDEYEADILSADDCADLFVAEPNATLIAHCPTYLAALVEVAKAANNGLFECENLESGEPWYKWLRAALDALTKAVQP